MYTVPASNRDGATSDTHPPAGKPGMRDASFVSHVLPPSFETLAVPSSDPVYSTPASFGDSASDTIVGQFEMPSLRAIVIWLPYNPITFVSVRSALVVRSALTATHE